MYIYIVYYCVLIVFCIIGLRVFHGLININQSLSLSLSLSLFLSLSLSLSLSLTHTQYSNE